MKKPLIFLVSCLFLANPFLAGSAAAQDADDKIFGYGTRGCFSWIEYENMQAAEFFFASQWLHGFVTGAAIWNEDIRPALVTQKGSDLEGWVSNYCSANPEQSIADAADQLVRDLINQSD
ncbi:MAG: hypothetical protein AAF530_17100 [Pseudomonadota bacterium]